MQSGPGFLAYHVYKPEVCTKLLYILRLGIFNSLGLRLLSQFSTVQQTQVYCLNV